MRQPLAVSHVAHPDLRFHTPSHKVEFVSERAVELGLPRLPCTSRSRRTRRAGPSAPAATYPLLFRQARSLTHFHAFNDHGQALPTLARADPEPRLWISPGDAATRRITDGQGIRIFNDRGAMNARAQVTDGVPAGSRLDARRLGGHQRADERLTRGPRRRREGVSGGQAAYEARVEVKPTDG